MLIYDTVNKFSTIKMAWISLIYTDLYSVCFLNFLGKYGIEHWNIDWDCCWIPFDCLILCYAPRQTRSMRCEWNDFRNQIWADLILLMISKELNGNKFIQRVIRDLFTLELLVILLIVENQISQIQNLRKFRETLLKKYWRNIEK